MPRKPKENYHQVNGRPHAGLDNPAKYGLTYSEVVELIDSGEWRNFWKRWDYKRKKGRKCSCCKEKKEVVETVSKIALCKDCKELVDRMERNME